jgi:putative tryptophan/tyrosine transport system substrate-binding protein
VARAAVASQPDAIISFGPIARWLKSVTATIPILATSSDPVALGIVQSLAKPDRNITGVSVDAGLEIYSKRLQLLNETVRSLTNVRLPTPASSLEVLETILARLRETAGLAANIVTPAVLGEKLDQAAFERAFDAMEKDRVDGFE